MCDEKFLRFGEGFCPQGLVAKEPTGAREERKRTQTAGEISLDITDFGEGLVWLFALDLKGR